MLLAVDQFISVPVLKSRSLEVVCSDHTLNPGDRITRLAIEGWHSINIEAMEAKISD